jgi:SAM-dependent methyltransferase
VHAATLGRILEMPLNGKSVLDIGCADGAASLSAARMGARVTGLEPRAHRLGRAKAIADATGLALELRNTTLAEFEAPAAAFDVVLALDVLDQVPDPIAFLERAARLTSSHLVLGYPATGDPERSRPGDPDLSASNLERHLVDHLGAFRHHEVIPTATPDRAISVFSGKKRKPRARRAVAAEPLPEPVPEPLPVPEPQDAEAGTPAVLPDGSRSWPVPASLRRVSDRMRWAVRGVRTGRAEDVLV